MRLCPLAAIAMLAFFTPLRAQGTVRIDLGCPSPCTFRPGESIWLNLDFASSKSDAYQVFTNYTDRDFAFEEFAVTPQEGVSDPVGPYMWMI